LGRAVFIHHDVVDDALFFEAKLVVDSLVVV